MDGYWRDPAATSEAMAGGWFRSGDIGYLDEQGFLFVVDRIKDVINRQGEKIAASEVESCILQHPGVLEVAVLAMPDDFSGEAVVAVVVPRHGVDVDAAAIQAHVAAQPGGLQGAGAGARARRRTAAQRGWKTAQGALERRIPGGVTD